MAFCSSCGAEVTGSFCDKCGTPAGGEAAPPQQGTQSGGLDTNIASLLCYFVIVAIIFLFVEPYSKNKTVRFHAFQSIFLCVGFTVLWIVLIIISGILSMVSGVLSAIFGLLTMLLGLAGFGLWLYLVYSAYQNKKVVLPVIGPMAEKQA